MNLNELWAKVLSLLNENTNEISYNTWFKPLKLISYENDIIILESQDDFIKNMLIQRYKNIIKESFEKILDKEIEVFFTIPGEDINKIKKINNTETKMKKDNDDNFFIIKKLNDKYKFDNFIIGNSNRFAHAASLAVAEAPATTYNPLFLYGGVGLGKTHLMNAIGHYILSNNPDSKILYVTSEKFMNDLIESIKTGTTNEFRNKYRKIDVLLIDDIQFIAGKESTQEEFFHTFNSLYEANKQIIICSDNPPSEIPTLEDRLRSRFEWGLIADIQPPDFETRIAILRKKAENEKCTIPDDVIEYIAQNIQSNIRKLEGALTRIIAFSSLNNKEINLDLAKEALKHLVSNNKKITVNDVQEATCNYYNITMDDLISKNKVKNIAYPRQVAMYLSRKLTDCSLPKIGDLFGGRDHTTVLHAFNKMNEEIESNNNLKKAVEDITSILNN